MSVHGAHATMQIFLSAFDEVPDPRASNARHDLGELLVIAFVSVLCGSSSCAEMAAFGRAKESLFRDFLRLRHAIPSHDTFSEVFRMIDPKALDAAKANAKRAGVDNCIDFTKGSFVSHPLLKQQPKDGKKSNVLDDVSQHPLLVVANPPYGKRLSPTSETKNTIYRQLANVLLSSSSTRSIDCAVIGKDVRVMRESGIPSLEVAFSTKHGGMSVAAMVGSLPKPNRA